MASIWTEPAWERCQELWAKGDTASQIAEKLTDEFGITFTRNAVLGRVHRHNLEGRAVTERNANQRPNYEKKKGSKKKVASKTPPALPLPPPPPPEPEPEPEPDPEPASDIPWPDLFGEEIPETGPGSILRLDTKTCRWPIGHPKEPGFSYCLKPSVPGKPYCKGHCKRAYTTPEKLRQATKEWRDQQKGAANGQQSGSI